LFSKPEEKLKLIKAFLPVISIKDLVDLEILKVKEAKKGKKVEDEEIKKIQEKAIKDVKEMILSNSELFKDFKINLEDENFLENINLKEISVPTRLLPIEKQNELFEAKLPKAIKEDINGLKDSINKDEQDKKIKFEKDENSNVTADFIKKVKADPSLNQKII